MSDIRKRNGKSGVSWQTRFKDPVTGKTIYKTFTSRKEADFYLSQVGTTNHKHAHDKKTIAKAADRWIEVCSTTGRSGREPVEKSTLRKYHLHARIIKEILGFEKINELSPLSCDEFRDELLERYSRKYAKKILVSFKSILSQARSDEVILHDPAENTAILLSSRTRKQEQVDIPGLDDISNLVNTAARNRVSTNSTTRNAWIRYAPFLYVLVFSGMRPCEVLGLPWKNVDFEKNTVTVTQDATEDREIGLPKSGSSYRTIPMPDHVMNELKLWKFECPRSLQDLVFPTGSGGVESHGNVTNRAWYPLQIQCGLVNPDGKPRYAMKSLRHVRASMEIHAKATAKEVQMLMGHSSIRVTYDIYGHLFNEHMEDRASRANMIADQVFSCGKFVA